MLFHCVAPMARRALATHVADCFHVVGEAHFLVLRILWDLVIVVLE
jgi:hypothetical protein